MLEELNTPFYFSQIWSELSYEISPLLKRVTLDSSILEQITLKDLAKTLVIKIKEKGITKVEITLPARALEEVPSLLSSQTKLEMEKAGIDITKVVEHHLKQGLKSETVVDFTDGTKHYLVELK
jgi:ribosome maturation protein Sdo1